MCSSNIHKLAWQLKVHARSVRGHEAAVILESASTRGNLMRDTPNRTFKDWGTAALALIAIKTTIGV
jgi:hypothetical protein